MPPGSAALHSAPCCLSTSIHNLPVSSIRFLSFGHIRPGIGAPKLLCCCQPANDCILMGIYKGVPSRKVDPALSLDGPPEGQCFQEVLHWGRTGSKQQEQQQAQQQPSTCDSIHKQPPSTMVCPQGSVGCTYVSGGPGQPAVGTWHKPAVVACHKPNGLNHVWHSRSTVQLHPC